MADHLHQQILKGLEGELNTNIFEACAVDLIRKDFPGLNPVVGGLDSGMDGAVADLEGEPFPLVCTTNESVITNFSGSLQSYIDKGGPRRKVMIVTNRTLSPIQQNNLKERAREKGFTLLQIYEKEAIAARLRESSRWSKELLGVTGNLPVLTKIPPNFRGETGSEVIGREEDLNWLRGLKGTGIISGQPGSGKTFITKKFAEFYASAFFMATKNEGELSFAIRELKPEFIIVDDAHVNVEQVDLLLRTKRELNADFNIIAVVWPSRVLEWTQKLGVGKDSVRELDLLSRDQIIQVIKGANLIGPPQLLGEIANQAEGKPGLAASLAKLCLEGNVKEIWDGNILAEFIVKSLEASTGHKVKEILAGFSIGGKSGMKLADVSRLLSLSQVEVVRAVAELEAAGIIEEHRGLIRVTPATLRFALVRDVFFRGGRGLDPSPFLELTPDFDETTITMLGAAHRGADVSDFNLTERVLQSDHEGVWDAFAWLGERKTEILLESKPENILMFLDPALKYFPAKTLNLLFEKSVGDNRPLHSHPGHPLRKIDDWVSHSGLDADTIQIRRNLLKAIIAWLDKGTHKDVAYKVLGSVFKSNFSVTSLDPGCGNTFQITQGTIQKDHAIHLEEMWNLFFNFLKNETDIQWKELTGIVHNLTYQPLKYDADSAEVCKNLAKKIIVDLSTLAKGHPAAVRSMREIADDLGVQGPNQEDVLFEKLFPQYPNREELETEHKKNIAEVVELWRTKSAEEVANEINRTDAEAKKTEITWPRLSSNVCWELSKIVSNPLEWAELFAAKKVVSDCVSPFLYGAISTGDKGWVDFTKKHINSHLRYELFRAAITHSDADDELLKMIDELASKYLDEVEHCVGSMPTSTLTRMLQHPDEKVRGHAAVGEWNSAKFGKREIRKEIEPLWQEAVVTFADEEYWLNEILRSDSHLAFKWVKNCFEKLERIGFECDKLIRSLCHIFSEDQRWELLNFLPLDDHYSRGIFRSLVGGDNSLLDKVLAVPAFFEIRSWLARWTSPEVWAERVIRLEKTGLSTKEISYGVLPRSRSWTGKYSDLLKSDLAYIEPMTTHDNLVVKEVAGHLADGLKEQIEIEIKRERRASVYGRG